MKKCRKRVLLVSRAQIAKDIGSYGFKNDELVFSLIRQLRDKSDLVR